jgi:hypothetical protein
MANILDKRDKSLAPTPGASAADKVVKFKWAKPTSPGQQMLLAKSVLNVDDRYQRGQTSHEAVKRIARDWDWSLFGVIKIAKRPDGTFWVFDGGHRTRAAFFRSDINDLPCIVFEWSDVADEARAFIAGARTSTRISSLDTFRAATVAMEPDACRTAALIKSLGMKVVQRATHQNELKCIHTIQNAVAENEEKATKCLQVCQVMAGDEPISGSVFRALFCLAQHFNGRDVISEFSEPLQQLTQAEAEKAIRQLKAEIGKGGQTIAAKAIVGLLNKGKKTRKLAW